MKTDKELLAQFEKEMIDAGCPPRDAKYNAIAVLKVWKSMHEDGGLTGRPITWSSLVNMYNGAVRLKLIDPNPPPKTPESELVANLIEFAGQALVMIDILRGEAPKGHDA